MRKFMGVMILMLVLLGCQNSTKKNPAPTPANAPSGPQPRLTIKNGPISYEAEWPTSGELEIAKLVVQSQQNQVAPPPAVSSLPPTPVCNHRRAVRPRPPVVEEEPEVAPTPLPVQRKRVVVMPPPPAEEETTIVMAPPAPRRSRVIVQQAPNYDYDDGYQYRQAYSYQRPYYPSPAYRYSSSYYSYRPPRIVVPRIIYGGGYRHHDSGGHRGSRRHH